MEREPDDTVRLRPARAGGGAAASARRLRGAAWWLPWAATVALLAAGLGAGAWLWWPAPVALHDPAAALQRTPALPLASEADILADAPDALATYRFAPSPSVVVLQFPTLAGQAAMLNRVAALVEKHGFPRDKVLARAELDQRIRDEGGSPDTFYYGHDYRAADITRFFDLATDLSAEERQLRDLVGQLGWRQPGAVGALVSLVRAASDRGLDEAGRAAVLRHELSHGVYFTDPDYAEFCRRFWRDTLTTEERANFTAFLAGDGYDTQIDDLVVNETQAYLMHTPDRRFFGPAAVGLTPRRLAELRQIFLVGMPPGWLRDATTVTPQP